MLRTDNKNDKTQTKKLFLARTDQLLGIPRF